ncbi:MAG: hypothetical protein JWO89_2753 [Verrucomicrobiaceae bacterium]|nr:hypothetical protein [Verrucomicrobiaceae bacterium]MDB6116517.1 hypothetical protein [Verrucomicrobiaceae bacterium]
MAQAEWYILKAAEQAVRGPLSMDQLLSWAAEAKIGPLDKISNDNCENWVRAPMVPELQMDWLIDMPNNRLYGPTSISTIQELLAMGDIDEHVTVINCLDGSSGRLHEQPFYSASPQHIRSAETVLHGTQMPGDPLAAEAGSILRQRVQWLEKQVMELQRDLGLAEEYNASLKHQFIEATGRTPQ